MAKKSFETALRQLEEIVREMESGELTLEQAVKKYEAGIAHTRFCMEILEQTEEKITQLNLSRDKTPKEGPFTHDTE